MSNYFRSTLLGLCFVSSTAFGGNWSVKRVNEQLDSPPPIQQTGTIFDVAFAQGMVEGAKTKGLAFVQSIPFSSAFARFDGNGKTTITATWISKRGDPPQPASHTFQGESSVTVGVEKAFTAFSHGEDDPTLKIGGGGTWNGGKEADAHCNLTLPFFTFPNEDFCGELDAISPTVTITTSPVTIVLESFVSPHANTEFQAKASANSSNLVK